MLTKTDQAFSRPAPKTRAAPKKTLTKMQLTTTLLGLAALAGTALGHGLVTKPVTREPGDATATVCGKKMVQFYKSDNTSYPEALMRANGLADPAYNPAKCNLYLCRGYQFADNTKQVLSYTEGETIDMEVYIRIPHKGYANVSVVDMAANKVIGAPLYTWGDGYADAKNFPNLPKNQTSFSVKVPMLNGKCAEAGACVSCLPVLWSKLPSLTLRIDDPVVLARPGPDVRVLHRLYGQAHGDDSRTFMVEVSESGRGEGYFGEGEMHLTAEEDIVSDTEHSVSRVSCSWTACQGRASGGVVLIRE